MWRKTLFVSSAIISVLSLIIGVSLFLVIKDINHRNLGMEVVRTEMYESSTEYLIIKYQNDGDFLFEKITKDGKKHFCCAASFIGESVAVYDGKQSMPESPLFYEFVFEDDLIKLYDRDELIGEYKKSPK